MDIFLLLLLHPYSRETIKFGFQVKKENYKKVFNLAKSMTTLNLKLKLIIFQIPKSNKKK